MTHWPAAAERAQREAPPPLAPPPRASESPPCSSRCWWTPPRWGPGLAHCARPWWSPDSPRSCAGRTSACRGRSSAEMRRGKCTNSFSSVKYFCFICSWHPIVFACVHTRWLRCKILDLISLYKLSLQVVSAWMWLFYCPFRNCELYFQWSPHLLTNQLSGMKNDNQTFKILVITDSLYPGYMIDIDNFGSHRVSCIDWRGSQLCGAVMGTQAGHSEMNSQWEERIKKCNIFTGIRCIQIEHPLNGWRNWMEFFHCQNKRHLPVFPQCALATNMCTHELPSRAGR